ncbi:MAG: hypothetical protein DKINENOH_01692 [bacterium]|nr:hypothetical protein [bacterium]
MSEGRNEKGRFVKGEYHGGPGRPRKPQDPTRQQIFAEVITAEKFRAACSQIWLDAVGKKIDHEGRLVDDPRSTPLARCNAFARIAAYSLGKPIQPILLDEAAGEVLAHFRSLSDAELDQIISVAQHILDSSKNQSSEET